MSDDRFVLFEKGAFVQSIGACFCQKGRKEGRKEGREGRKEGRGKKEGREGGREGGRKEGSLLMKRGRELVFI